MIDLIAVQKIVRSVREIVMPFYGKIEFTEKGGYGSNFLTEMDVKVETYLRDRLAVLHPDVAFVGEELGGDRTAARKWICDPIDGTAHYIRGAAFCTTMLALAEDGKVNVGIIYDFVNDVMYSAERGQGAFREGERIHVSDRPLKHAYLSWETHLQKPENLPMHLLLLQRCGFFKTQTAGYEFIMVAEGKLEGRLCFDPWGGDYDYAAGSLLVEEAGGVVANIGSDEYDYTNLNFLAANPGVYAELTTGPDAIFPVK